MKNKSIVEISVSYGMVVWSTGLRTRPVILDLMKQIGQGCHDVYALGDCATISQRRLMDDISEIFKVADKDNSGTLTVKEIQDVLEDIYELYPQVEFYLKSKHMTDIFDLLNDCKGSNTMEVSIQEFKKALANVDSEVKIFPATAQVAAQQGAYLAMCFNRINEVNEHPEGLLRIGESGQPRFHPFRYISSA